MAGAPQSVPLQGDSFNRENAHFANLKVRAQYTPTMTVRISAGGFWVDNSSYCEYTGGNSPTFTAASSNAKWTLVLLNSSSRTIELLDSAEAASPTFPSVTSGRIALAAVFIQTTTTSITNDMVFDCRPIFQIGADIAGASVGDITGLTSQLDLKADSNTVSSLLANKADASGTNVAVFELNKNHTGVPGENAGIRVNRGAGTDVEIRWNESASAWQFTDDGVVYRTMGSTFVDVSTLTASVAANASSITVLQASVTALQASVTANASTLVVINASVAANASAIVVLQASVTANASAIAVLEAGTNHPFDLHGFVSGSTTGSAILDVFPASRAFTIPTQNHAGAWAAAVGAEPTSLNIKHGGGASALTLASIVGTIAWASNTLAGSVNIAASITVAVGDVVVVQEDGAIGSTVQDFGWNIQATTD
jgi:hypothetical protein